MDGETDSASSDALCFHDVKNISILCFRWNTYHFDATDRPLSAHSFVASLSATTVSASIVTCSQSTTDVVAQLLQAVQNMLATIQHHLRYDRCKNERRR